MNYRIKYCTRGDIPAVMGFVNRHWSEGHVLATNRGLFEWQFWNPRHERYDLLVGWEENPEAIVGLYGRIESRLYDSAVPDHEAVTWASLWRRRDDVDGYFGIELMATFLEGNHSPFFATGLNTKTVPFYEYFGFVVAPLEQWYVVNPQLTRFSLFKGEKPPEPGEYGTILRTVDSQWLQAHASMVDGLTPRDVIPRKTAVFTIRRYLQHPWYRYIVYAITRKDAVLGILVARVAKHANARALRVVDFIGPESALKGVPRALAEILEETGMEYADFHQRGLDSEFLSGCGFTFRPPQGGSVIVPNYFEPFVAENINVLTAIPETPGKKPRIFRADGDQDRPNQLPPDSSMNALEAAQ